MVALLDIPKIQRKPKVYTFEEYLRREERAIEKHEFYNGKITKMPGGTDIHSEVSTNASTALKLAVRPLPTKFRVYNSDLKIYVEPADTGVYPDALVICEQPEFWNNRRDVIVNPLLIVEVLSPSTQNYDKLGKFELYKLLPSFKEYVLVNTDYPSVETRFREEPDLWRIRTQIDMGSEILLKSLGVSILMTDLYDGIEFLRKQ
jgi:Uma2 family endonuclease